VTGERTSQEPTLSVEVARSLDTVALEEWASLTVGKSIYASWAWYRSLERDERFSPRYLLVRDPQGRLLGAMPIYHTSGGGNPFYNPATAFEEFFARSTVESWVPGLSLGSRAAYMTQLLVTETSDRRRIVEFLLNSAFGPRADASASDVVATWMFYVPEPDATLVASLMPSDALVLYGGADQTLHVEWSSFDAYLGALSGRRRSSVRKELAAFGRSGGSVVRASLGPDTVPRIAPLFAETQTKYGRPTESARAESFLLQQAEYLAGFSRVFLCERNGQVVGFALFYEYESVLHARLVGFDYSALGSYEYFATLFYEPIRYAIENGLQRIHFGFESYDGKLGRGASPSPLWCFVRHRDVDLSVMGESARAWNVRKMTDFVERYRSFLREGVRYEPSPAPGTVVGVSAR